METQRVMMVQIADPAWTLEALHCAGAMARQQSAKIVLVKMVPVQHLGWLGTDFGYLNISEQERGEIADYQSTLEDYGVEFELCLFQYATLADALVQAAEYVDAQVVFATLPESLIPFWRNYQLRNLRRSLTRSSRDWVEHPDDALTPASASALAATVSG